MILNYSFENFFSFANETTVDLTSTAKATTTLYDYQSKDGYKVNKVSAVFGANGSGKSNLLKPLAFLNWFFNSSFSSLSNDEGIPIKPHFARENDNIKINVEFLSFSEKMEHSLRFKYGVELNQDRVFKEELKIKTSKLYSSVFLREYAQDKKVYTYKTSKRFFNFSPEILSSTPKNASLVSFLQRLVDADGEEINKSIENTDLLSKNVVRILAMTFGLFSSNLCLNGRIADSVDKAVLDSTDLYSKDDVVFQKVSKLISDFDIGIDSLEISDEEYVNENGEKKKIKVPFAIHTHDNEEYVLPLLYESSGTKSAYNILHSIMQKLTYGGVAIVDELDNDLHPLLLLETINLFKDSETNPMHAQLIFSTHTPEVLKHLKKHHCFIVEKENSESDVWRLDDIDGIRSQDNLYSKYMSGALGGIPMVGR
ncbi:AAA family ATPase [Aeromonas jandaei]|uniref:AAA family ATPase n=1 Tax=Aeromonas jandaei TaxID=650 RepID=UPI001932E028|nr:ATP-binding protein [Aeromonas jandaei]MBM0493428.1 ATP-binding protein [Aeromonas jandaei]MBM0571163.1 AAA family ATPase [Aeromonas jandaei]